MALHFKKNMFWCWRSNGVTKGMIGFTNRNGRFIFDFRNKLVSNISSKKGFIIQSIEGQPTKLDSIFWLFDENDEEIVTLFFNKKKPNFLATIFKTKYYRDWQTEFNAIMKLPKVVIETSHDFCGVMVYSAIYSTEEMVEEINNVARELRLELFANRNLENINIYSNRTFS